MPGNMSQMRKKGEEKKVKKLRNKTQTNKKDFNIYKSIIHKI